MGGGGGGGGGGATGASPFLVEQLILSQPEGRLCSLQPPMIFGPCNGPEIGAKIQISSK